MRTIQWIDNLTNIQCECGHYEDDHACAGRACSICDCRRYIPITSHIAEDAEYGVEDFVK